MNVCIVFLLNFDSVKNKTGCKGRDFLFYLFFKRLKHEAFLSKKTKK